MTRLSSTSLPWYRGIRHTDAEPPQRTRCIHQALAAAIRQQPDRALLVDQTRHLGNAELLHLIDRRARLLLARCGGLDAVVAVHLDAGIELVITYFACLQAGLRYLPLPWNPTNVTRDLLHAMAPRLLVTSRPHDLGASSTDTLYVEEENTRSHAMPLPAPDPSRIAHVLLTSGTATGVPRMVLTDHEGSMFSHTWRTRLWPYDRSRDVVGCNIFGIWDVVPALLNGVPAVMLEDATLRDPFALAAAIVRYGITRLMITPTLLDACLACSDAVAALRRLRLVVLCGEAVTAPLMQRVSDRLPGVNVANLYSLAECHDVAAGVMTPDRPAGSCRVADFADVHVVVPEQRDTLLPAGRQGRILVGGRGLARGYLDQRVTAGKFFETTFGGILTPRRVYDTGDLGRLDLDGTLEVVGRIDTEVKIRGAWADPNAVAALLLQHPGVIRAATVIRADSRGHARLHAFVVPSRDASSDLGAMLHADLRTRLPPQSVPARIELLNELPLLPSGKIDTARLASTGAGLASGPAIRPRPARSLGDTVLTTFREVLEQPAVKATDRFDALGGDSLAAIVLCGHIRERTGKPLRLQELYQHPTAAALADFLERHPPTASPNPPFLPFDPLPPAAPPRAERARGGPFRNVLVTGATGTLGATLLPLLIERTDVQVTALVRAIDDTHARARLASALPDQMPLTRVTAVAGDLAQPRLGLAPDRYSQLAGDVDAVLHLGARLDMFAAYDTLAAVNVDGTRAALELALVSGAVFHHLSSSSVLPLDSEERWDETHYGRALLESLAARLVASDGYSQTKLAAETLVWQAAERGLEVIVTRVPHLVGRHHRSRLTDTLEALLELGILPEGGWHWQLAPVDAVCDHLIRHVQMDQSPLYQRHCPLEHVVAPPLTDSDLEAALAAQGRRPRRLTLPALANVIAAAARQRAGGTRDHLSRNLAALDQLAREYGIRAALCLSEPLLESRQPVSVDPARLLVDWLPD